MSDTESPIMIAAGDQFFSPSGNLYCTAIDDWRRDEAMPSRKFRFEGEAPKPGDFVPEWLAQQFDIKASERLGRRVRLQRFPKP